MPARRMSEILPAVRKMLPVVIGATALGIALFVNGGLSAMPQAPATTATPPANTVKTAAEQYKNIQVLKDIPADQLVPAMQFMTASLGVECEYCHVRGAFDKDDKKPKVTARKMITMMLAINKDNFEGHRDVTCYSCHRGAANPVAIPVIGEEESVSIAEVASSEKSVLPSADQLLDKYLAAVGGAAALQKITSRVGKGTATFSGQSVAVDVYAKAPDKRLSVMHLKDGDSLTAFDGHQGWLSVPNRTHMMSAAENAAARIDADFYFPIDIKTMYEKYRVESGEKIDGHDTYLVIGQREGRPPLHLYFDKQTGLLIRLVRYADTPLGRNPTQIDYADYRDSEGVNIPFRWTLARPGNQFTIQLEQLQLNVAIDDDRFAAPPPPKPATK